MTEPPVSANDPDAAFRGLLPRILAGGPSTGSGDSAPQPGPRPGATPARWRNWSDTLELINRATVLSSDIERKHAECDARTQDLVKAIGEENLRCDALLRTVHERTRAIEAEAEKIERQVMERKAQLQTLASRLNVVNQDASFASASAARVESWLDRLHGSIQSWHSAADPSAPAPKNPPASTAGG